MRISDWSSDVCSSDLLQAVAGEKDLMVGIALSGGAQPSLSRLDIGPQISARLPIGKGHARLALEWRQRIAGRARPPSGLAVLDRKRVVAGKSVTVRVDLGGRRII